MASKSATLRLVFTGIAVIIALGLSFRPIPGTFSANDTGRYVQNQSDACGVSTLGNRETPLTQQVFDLMARPACWTGQPRFFLFITSFALPLAFIVFGDWREEGALLLALGLLLSTTGFELMTDALRQSASLIFLLGAFYFRRKPVKLLSLAAALLVHDSNWVFAPLLLMVGYPESTAFKWRRSYTFWLVPIIALAAFAFALRFSGQISEMTALLKLYTLRYAEKESIGFLLFMILPMYWIFFVRWWDPSSCLSRGEKASLLYGSAIFVLTAIYFPYITYRFALTSIVLQVFLTMRAARIPIRSSYIIACGLVLHLMIYIVFSHNVAAVLNG